MPSATEASPRQFQEEAAHGALKFLGIHKCIGKNELADTAKEGPCRAAQEIMKPQRLVERQIVVVPERIGGPDILRPTGLTQIDPVRLRNVLLKLLLKMLEVAWVSIGKRVKCSCPDKSNRIDSVQKFSETQCGLVSLVVLIECTPHLALGYAHRDARFAAWE